MSHDPQSPSDAADYDYDYGGGNAFCEECGEEMFTDELNVEAFELSGHIVCADCAERLSGEDQ